MLLSIQPKSIVSDRNILNFAGDNNTVLETTTVLKHYRSNLDYATINPTEIDCVGRIRRPYYRRLTATVLKHYRRNHGNAVINPTSALGTRNKSAVPRDDHRSLGAIQLRAHKHTTTYRIAGQRYASSCKHRMFR